MTDILGKFTCGARYSWSVFEINQARHRYKTYPLNSPYWDSAEAQDVMLCNRDLGLKLDYQKGKK